MPFSDEFCLIHGHTIKYDWRSGFDMCEECEQERIAITEQEAEREARWQREVIGPMFGFDEETK